MIFMFFMFTPLVHSASHTFMTIYSGVNEWAVAGTPEIFAKTTLDGRQIDYYDSDTGVLSPEQDWMKEFTSGDRWKKYIEIRERVQQTNKLNITLVMQQFSHSDGVRMYKRRYGCEWDDETEVSHGFDKYSYDGKPFFSLDLEEGRFTAHVPQAESTVMKWNNDREQLDFLKQYYKHECIDWLKELLNFSKPTISGQNSTEPTQKNLTTDDTETWSKLKPGLFVLLLLFIYFLPYHNVYLYLKYRNKSETSNNKSRTGKVTVIYEKENSIPNPSDEPDSSDNLSDQCLLASSE